MSSLFGFFWWVFPRSWGEVWDECKEPLLIGVLIVLIVQVAFIAGSPPPKEKK